MFWYLVAQNSMYSKTIITKIINKLETSINTVKKLIMLETEIHFQAIFGYFIALGLKVSLPVYLMGHRSAIIAQCTSHINSN